MTTQLPLLPAPLRAAVPLLLLALAGLWAAPRALAQATPNPPERLTYQGFLADGNGNALATNAPQNYDVVFRIWNDAAASAPANRLWTEQQTVTVDKGYFSVLLGEGTAVGAEARTTELSTLFTGPTASDRFMGLTVKGIGAGAADVDILPRLRLLTSPYAFLARNATALISPNGSNLVTSANGQLTVNGTLGATAINAAGLTGLTAGQVPNLDANKITTGTLDGARLGANVALLNRTPQTFSGVNSFAGNVGIGGTEIPQSLLHLRSMNINGAAVILNSGGIQSTISQKSSSSSDRALQFHNQTVSGTDQSFNFLNNNAANLMTIQANGNVGIGSTSPAFRLHVQDPGANTGRIHVGGRSSGGTPKLISFGDGDFVTIGENGQDDTMELTASRFYFNTGNVGIGTSTPTKAKLEINGSGSSTGFGTDTFDFFTLFGGVVRGSAGSYPLSLYASGRIAASHFMAFSDERMKKIEGHSDGAMDLRTLLGLEITDYHYKDVVAKGNDPQKKVIAQQVEKVFPQAVSKSTDVVPDIYQKAVVKDGWVELATNLKKGERVRLIGEKKEGIHEVLEVAEGRFRTEFKPEGDKVFVFGREVSDFRSVDYEAIAMLNVSATQELAKRLEKLEARETHLADLEQKAGRVATLEQEVADLKKMVAQLAKAAQGTEQAVKTTPPHHPTDAPAGKTVTTASLER